MEAMPMSEHDKLKMAARLYLQAIQAAHPDLKESVSMRVMRKRLEKLSDYVATTQVATYNCKEVE